VLAKYVQVHKVKPCNEPGCALGKCSISTGSKRWAFKTAARHRITINTSVFIVFCLFVCLLLGKIKKHQYSVKGVRTQNTVVGNSIINFFGFICIATIWFFYAWIWSIYRRRVRWNEKLAHFFFFSQQSVNWKKFFPSVEKFFLAKSFFHHKTHFFKATET